MLAKNSINIELKIAAILIFVGASLALTCSAPTNPNQNVASPLRIQTYKSVGIIKSIDIDTDRVTVDHEEIPDYMSAMEMNEMVADHELLGGLKVGDKVEFEIERKGSSIIYTKFNTIAHVALVDGGEVFKSNCATCHGGNGEGLKKGIPLTSGHALDHTEAEYTEQVKNGEGTKMPPFRDKLSTEQLAAVVSFVRNTIQAGIPPEKRKGHHH